MRRTQRPYVVVVQEEIYNWLYSWCVSESSASATRADQFVFASVLLLATRMQRAYDARLPELSLKQWLTLLLLYRIGGDAASVAQIAELSGSSHQNITKMIALLARDGWVKRSVSSTDRRALHVAVTQRTLAYFSEHEELGDRLLAELFSGIPDADVEATARTLATMQQNLQAGERRDD